MAWSRFTWVENVTKAIAARFNNEEEGIEEDKITAEEAKAAAERALSEIVTLKATVAAGSAVLGEDGTVGGPKGSPLTSSVVSSSAASNGQVPIANGSGGYAWGAQSGSLTEIDGGTPTETGATSIDGGAP